MNKSKQKTLSKVEERIPQRIQNNAKTTSETTNLPITYKAKGRTPVQGTSNSNSVMRTRSSNRLKNTGELKNDDEHYEYDSNATIEVFMDDIGDDQDVEYILAETMDNAFDDPFQSTDSNDEVNSLMVDDTEFDTDQYVLKGASKSDEMYSSDESLDDKPTDEDETGNFLLSGLIKCLHVEINNNHLSRFHFCLFCCAEILDENYYDTSLLESILPKIKQSIAAKNGTVLDDETQYKIVRTNGNEIKVQCITSDGKEFEIEMVEQPNPGYERDESGDLKIFSCSKCPKTFSRRGKLINHERDHNAKTNGQECPYCQKWFPSNSTLTRHIRVHTGEKPFKCNICNRSFIQKEILKRHLMTHSGERPFKCAHCPKSFILKKALSQHINRNHTENPTPEMHNCPFCPKVCTMIYLMDISLLSFLILNSFQSFCHSSGLSRHLLIHAGRTFACEYCHKKFNDKSALKRHTVSIHNATPKREKN